MGIGYRIRAYPVNLLRNRDVEIIGISKADIVGREIIRLLGEVDRDSKPLYRQLIVEVAPEGGAAPDIDSV